MTGPHLDLAGALRIVADGGYVPPSKFGALIRRGFVKVRGKVCHRHGRQVVVVTDEGRAFLRGPASPPRPAPTARHTAQP